MIQSTTWLLTEMCKTQLKSDCQDIDPDDTASYFNGNVSSPGKLLTFIQHCELDAHYQMVIAAKVQILPLTKQLTNLTGNSWSVLHVSAVDASGSRSSLTFFPRNKTLNSGCAKRNKYILLHEFH
jgi:DNA polymerase alpha subunit A